MAVRKKKTPVKGAPKNNAEKRDKNGRWKKGHCGGPGRPRGYDFRKLVEERCEKEGKHLTDALYDVYLAMLEKAKNGDVQAAKLLLDKLCDDPQRLHVTYEGEVTEIGPKIPTSPIELKRWAKKLSELVDDERSKSA